MDLEFKTATGQDRPYTLQGIASVIMIEYVMFFLNPVFRLLRKICETLQERKN